MGNENIVVDKETMDKIELKLRGLKLQLQDKTLIKDLQEIIDLLEGEIKTKANSLQENIKEKMNETKHSNPEVHFKFYMLYRKLADNQITEEEALKAYEIYIRD
ncbi:hypothetical protein [Desnuesiella massiliensis]|uniref:hypothetical protein n=1 Tax=Desnuesiella massiliensis TaxID=1650662 RepID=UPI0006E3807E|nr:hypothetical protein [Desnuesiella massiliensis]